MRVPKEIFHDLYRENYSKVFAFIYNLTQNRQLSEDITQETFTKALVKLDSYQGKAKIHVWLNKIAHNTLVDHYKKKTNQEIINEDMIKTTTIDLSFSLEKRLEQKIMSECVQNKLNLLPENHRGVIYLDMNNYTDKEIAEILDCTVENVKVKLFRGRKKLKEILSDQCSFYKDEGNIMC